MCLCQPCIYILYRSMETKCFPSVYESVIFATVNTQPFNLLSSLVFSQQFHVPANFPPAVIPAQCTYSNIQWLQASWFSFLFFHCSFNSFAGPNKEQAFCTKMCYVHYDKKTKQKTDITHRGKWKILHWAFDPHKSKVVNSCSNSRTFSNWIPPLPYKLWASTRRLNVHTKNRTKHKICAVSSLYPNKKLNSHNTLSSKYTQQFFPCLAFASLLQNNVEWLHFRLV